MSALENQDCNIQGPVHYATEYLHIYHSQVQFEVKILFLLSALNKI